MISARIENLPALTSALRGYGSQIPFAMAVALTSSAHAVNRSIQAEMRSDIAGGPTPYTLRSFHVTPATKQTQQAVVGLKTAPAGGTPYEQAIGHLFRGGVRLVKIDNIPDCVVSNGIDDLIGEIFGRNIKDGLV